MIVVLAILTILAACWYQH
ncbi:MAG: hypothetical protein ACI32B_08775 [Erysipelotrichaceae bacterium]